MLTASGITRPPVALASAVAAATPAVPPEITTCPGELSVGHLHDISRLDRGLLAEGGDLFILQFEDGGHAARRVRAGLGHQLAARAGEPDGIRKSQCAGGHQGAILTQAVPRDAEWPRQFRPSRGQSAPCRDTCGQDRWLGIPRIGQHIARASKTEGG